MITGMHIFLRRWTQGLKLSKGAVNKIPVWIQLHDVPLEYWTADGLSYLASAVGLPLYADSDTENYRRVSFARICVELDASKPLVKEFEAITMQSSQDSSSSISHFGTAKIRVSYQWKPPACSLCAVFKHSLEAC